MKYKKHLLLVFVLAIFLLPLFVKGNSIEMIETEIELKVFATVPIEEDKIEILIDAIETMEGNYAGTIATVNNNPCNLRWGINQLGKRNGFSYFKDYETGRKACRHQITISSDGRSKSYSPEMTLLDFFNIYAPSSDDNEPSIYYEFVIKQTGFEREMELRELLL